MVRPCRPAERRARGAACTAEARRLIGRSAALLVPHLVDDYTQSQDAMKAWDALAAERRSSPRWSRRSTAGRPVAGVAAKAHGRRSSRRAVGARPWRTRARPTATVPIAWPSQQRTRGRTPALRGHRRRRAGPDRDMSTLTVSIVLFDSARRHRRLSRGAGRADSAARRRRRPRQRIDRRWCSIVARRPMPDARFLPSPTNIGFAAGQNRAIALEPADLHSSSIPTVGWRRSSWPMRSPRSRPTRRPQPSAGACFVSRRRPGWWAVSRSSDDTSSTRPGMVGLSQPSRPRPRRPIDPPAAEPPGVRLRGVRGRRALPAIDARGRGLRRRDLRRVVLRLSRGRRPRVACAAPRLALPVRPERAGAPSAAGRARSTGYASRR